MKINSDLLVGTFLVLLMCGCASGKKKNTIAVSTIPANPVVQVIPQPTREKNPRVAMPTSEAEPIYRNPVIEEIESAPFVNEEGNLVFPGKMLIIREPGHWNLDAAQRKNTYFIPVENQPAQLVPPSRSFYDFVQQKKNGTHPSSYDVSKVRVTGFATREERPEASKTLQPGEVLVFDPYLGWLAIPENMKFKMDEPLPSGSAQRGSGLPVQPTFPEREGVPVNALQPQGIISQPADADLVRNGPTNTTIELQVPNRAPESSARRSIPTHSHSMTGGPATMPELRMPGMVITNQNMTTLRQTIDRAYRAQSTNQAQPKP